MYNRTTVYICGQPFNLLTKEDSEYVKEIAGTLNNKLDQYFESDSSLPIFSASILSNMHFIGELKKQTNGDDNLRKQLKDYIDENETMRKKLSSVELDLNKLLKNDNNQYIDAIEYECIKEKIHIKEDELLTSKDKNKKLNNKIVEKDDKIKGLNYKITELENKILILEKQNNILRYGNK